MFSRSKSSLIALAVLGLAMAGSHYAIAQDEAAGDGASLPAKLTLIAENGDRLDYTVSDASLYLSTSVGYEGSPATTDLTLSLSTIAPINAQLLEWAAQTGGKSKDDYDIVLSSTLVDAEGETREVEYEITGALVNSFSTSVSVYAPSSVSVSLTGGKLVMDGVEMN